MMTSIDLTIKRITETIFIILLLAIVSCMDNSSQLEKHTLTFEESIYNIFSTALLDSENDKDFDFCTFLEKKESSIRRKIEKIFDEKYEEDFCFTITMKEKKNVYYYFETETGTCKKMDEENIPKHIYYKTNGIHVCMPAEYWTNYYSERKRFKNGLNKIYSNTNTSFFIELRYNPQK